MENEKIIFRIFFENIGKGKPKEVFYKDLFASDFFDTKDRGTIRRWIKNGTLTQEQKIWIQNYFKREFDFRSEKKIQSTQAI